MNSSLFDYFGKVCTDEKLPDPQGELTRDFLLSAISYTNTERGFPDVLVHDPCTP